MKKLTAVSVFAAALFAALCAFGAGVSVRLNGAPIDMRDAAGNEVAPFIENGTAYVPVRAIATALNVGIDWDNGSRTVFIGERGEAAPEAGENVNVYINGAEFKPTDAAGKAVYPIIKDGTTFLPVRAIAQAFAKKVDWDAAGSSVLITDTARLDSSKTYKIVLKDTDSAIMPKGSGNDLMMSLFVGAPEQLWRFVPVEGQDGFYQIVNLASERAIDVNGGSRAAGAKIIHYAAGDGDNQKFMLVGEGDVNFKIFSKNSMLPFEASAGEVRQNVERESPSQLWSIIEASPTEQTAEEAYTAVVLPDGRALTYSDDSTVLSAAPFTGADEQRWSLVPNAEGFYFVQTKVGGKSIDVANNSTTDGDPLITYTHSGDDNQRWIFEKQSGGYKIKSVHSGLYIKVLPDGSVVHSAEGDVFELK